MIAFDQPGTTRDAIEVPFERDGRRYTLIDTAGVRRRGKVGEAVEKFSVVKTLQAIEEANVVVLLLDARQGVTEQDAHIAGYILERGRALVLAVNKWDAVDKEARERMKRELALEARLPRLRRSAFHLGAARARASAPLMRSVDAAHAVGDGAAADAEADARAAGGGRAPGAAARPGCFRPEAALRAPGRHESAAHHHPRQLARARAGRLQALPRGHFRDDFKLVGTPLRIEFRTGRNPYAKKAR